MVVFCEQKKLRENGKENSLFCWERGLDTPKNRTSSFIKVDENFYNNSSISNMLYTTMCSMFLSILKQNLDTEVEKLNCNYLQQVRILFDFCYVTTFYTVYRLFIPWYFLVLFVIEMRKNTFWFWCCFFKILLQIFLIFKYIIKLPFLDSIY